jgi:Uma2 family endonuclease
MTIYAPAKLSAAQFDQYAQLPENAGRRLEFSDGQIYEKPPRDIRLSLPRTGEPMSSNTLASFTAARLLVLVGMYLFRNPIGYFTGTDGGYQFGDRRYIPDFAFTSYSKQTTVQAVGYNPILPDLVVEVISDPENILEQRNLRLKIQEYLKAGVVVWIFDPFDRHAEVYSPGESPLLLGEADTIDGGTILPGFVLVVGELFTSFSPPTATP